ncbi:hypothetical protein Glove_172g58 [Diversispora epigaea]|uniref:6-phosphogluconolactonase n=1 Tax=Diversispora epigaea TaxID=1348612 RepID=A0A397IPE4_9GLOM|nr:hypothetical protein Glove_172g58 [Diversispora epigaea]
MITQHNTTQTEENKKPLSERTIIKPTAGELSDELADFVVKSYNTAIVTRGRGKFTVGISGGSLPKILAAGLKNVKEKFDWDKWDVFFCDERIVPLDHEDSNYFLCQKELFDHLPIPPERIHVINSDLVEKINSAYKSGETEKGEEFAQEIVDDYEKQLVSVFGFLNPVKYPVFDLLLLGLGPDGHTCSLFPDHPLLEETLWVGYIDNSPKPPSRRITLTLPVINHAHDIVFVATGENKQDILKKILDENNDEDKPSNLPAKLVKPVKGIVYWYLDQSAAAKLNL